MVNLSDYIATEHDHDSTYLLKSNNLSDVSDASTSVSNLGALEASNNLSDVNNSSTARSNLGLGSAATRDFTISTGSPSGGSDGDVWYQV